MEAQIFTALTFNIPCVARCRHYDQIQRSLTAGCDGIIVPGNDDKINKCMDMSEFSKLRGLAMLPTTIYKRSFQTKPVILVEGKTLLFDGKTMKSDTLTASYVQVPDTVPEMIKNRIEKQNQKQAKFKADALTGGICQTGLFINSASHEVILGLGLLGYEAALTRDYPVIFATLYFFSLLGLIMGIIGDFMYSIIDPRIDFESR